MKNTIKITKELKNILVESYKEAKENNLNKITTLNILSKILNSQFSGTIKNKNLEKFLKTLPKEDLEDLKNYCNELKEDIILEDKGELDKSNTKNICFSDELTAIFEESNEFVNKNSFQTNEVSSEILLYHIIKNYEFDSIFDILDENTLLSIINNDIKFDTKEFFKDLESLSDKQDNFELENILDKLFNSSPITSNKENIISPNPVPENIQKEDEENFEKYGDNSPISGSKLDPNSKTPILDQFSDDMTLNAKNGKYDPIIGRDSIIDSVIEILCKRKKANVAIVGVAGSGKSSLVERLAQRIVSGKVPEQLKDKRICSLDLNNLVAGTKFRGEYEERLQKIIKEVCDCKNVIIYIDELHNLVGSGGSTTGNGDGANILKPYLARGEFQCIGSTTIDEYRKFIEKDAALNRRFTQIELKEPGKEETIKILNGIKTSYEKYHKVLFNKEVINCCVEWSSRYITDKHQPDKAIDILDLSGSLASLKHIDNSSNPDEIELQKIIKDKIEAITKKCDYELGEQLDKKEEELRAKIEQSSKDKDNKKNWIEVTIEDVATAISKTSKVPVDKINQTDREMLGKMKGELSKLVVGQDKAISEVVKNIQRSYLGFRVPGKPIFTGMFVGNTGTGKTLICKEIARIFFGSEHNLIKIDCGELRERGSVSKLLGTTAGYIGYGDQAPLLDQVKRKPSSVVLLDEIEKCDPSIYEIFMNILDEGYCILGDSTRVDFTNTIIIFTGNVGTKELREQGGKIGFVEEDKSTKSEAIIRKAINKTFKPEFINRLSSIVVFNELGKSEMSKIFNLEINSYKKLLKKRLNLKVSEKIKNKILDKVDYRYGARDLKRLIETNIIDPVTESYCENQDASTFTVTLDEKNETKVIVE